MDRHTGQGYGHTSGTGKPMTQTIKEHIPGTPEYQATHGVTPAHHNAEQMKTHIPGTDEHRMREAGVVHGTGMSTGAGMHTHHNTAVGQPTMGERIKQSIPGTNEYEATHGMTGAHRTVEQAKAHVPGTDEHRIYEATRPGYAGTGMGTHTGTTGMGHHTGVTNTGYAPHTTTSTTHTSTYTDTNAGMGQHVGEKKGLGEKIMEALPGTREHEAKKMAQGRF
ncbi:hypothetical protein COO60DRAFT_1537194 [Scenedesmus sp. NREL 46B-D3]|nr:hypothetical protein COO60DRAFT_1537194 [Scenedesmus sp. NREL 46B-D3]